MLLVFFLLLLAAAFIQELLLGLCLFCEIKELQTIPAIDHLCVNSDHDLNHWFCSKLMGMPFSWVVGVVEVEEPYYPGGFEGFAGENKGERGQSSIGRKRIHSAQA
nr:hypothetical protein [Tanacetum cinerariifolium]